MYSKRFPNLYEIVPRLVEFFPLQKGDSSPVQHFDVIRIGLEDVVGNLDDMVEISPLERKKKDCQTLKAFDQTYGTSK